MPDIINMMQNIMKMSNIKKCQIKCKYAKYNQYDAKYNKNVKYKEMPNKMKICQI